jgi:hypothetical protein
MLVNNRAKKSTPMTLEGLRRNDPIGWVLRTYLFTEDPITRWKKQRSRARGGPGSTRRSHEEPAR